MSSPATATPANLAPPPRHSLLARLQPRQRLAIDGLPPALAWLDAARAYVVYAPPSPARDALFWQTAAAALRSPATVLSTRAPGAVAEALRAHGLDIEAPRAVHPRANLCTLRPLPGRDGTEVLVEALQALAGQCAAPGSQFLVEGAEAFFAWDDAEALARQGAQLAAWCAHHRHGVLLVLAAPAIGEDRTHAELEAFQSRFAGAAQLMQVDGQYNWEVAFWRDRQAMLASESIPLRFSPVDYRLMVADDVFEAQLGEAGLLAPDEGRVIVSREAVLRERSVPAHWQVVDSNEAAVAAAGHAVAATVILGYGADGQLEKLGGQVYALRRQAGHALKIVVRETRAAMRYAQVLLSLGANLVIPLGSNSTRALAMVEGIQGQVHTRPLPADYHAALSAVLGSAQTGYVTAPRFVELVREAVARSRLVQLPSALLRLPLLAEVAHVDALQACVMRRHGDLVTACGDSLYVFFFGCRLDDVDPVCRRVFQRPLPELFAGDLRSGDRESIAATLDALDQEAARQPPPDYTTWLAQHPAPPAPRPETGPAADADDGGGEAAPASPPPRPDARRWPPRPAALPLKALG